MFAFVTIAFFLLPLLSAAQLVPTGPSPGQMFKQGAPCIATWTPDTTGKWKSTFIELMTGSNQGMVHLTTVSNVDGTDPSKTSFSFPCPEVAPNSAIYFLQFTAPDQSAAWTGRFAISDPSGATTPPPFANQPDGSPIPWGTGKLVNTQGSPPPPTAPGDQTDGSNGASSNASVLSVSGASSASSPVFIASTQSSPSSASSTSASATPSPSSSSFASNSGINSAAVPTDIATLSSSPSTPAAVTASSPNSSATSSAIINALPATPALLAAALLGLSLVSLS